MLYLQLLALFIGLFVHFIINIIVLHFFYQDEPCHKLTASELMERVLLDLFILAFGWIMFGILWIGGKWNREL